MQNVGAYGQEVASTIESVIALDLRDGQLHELCNQACGLRYRRSIFNSSERGRYIILQVNYALKHGGDAYIAYAELKKYFAGWSEKPTLANIRDAVRKIRAGKGMLITAGDDDCRSVGSFFKNPILSAEQYQALTARAAAKNLQIPSYPALDAQKKVSAAWLVEHSGFSKGIRQRIRRHFPQARAGDRESRECNCSRDCGFQGRYSAARARDLGHLLEPEPVFVGF